MCGEVIVAITGDTKSISRSLSWHLLRWSLAWTERTSKSI